MMKTINAILASPGAAPVLAAKIIGRVIGQVANGFGKDEQLTSELSVYKAIATKYPKDTISLNDMFKTMRGRANTEIDNPIDTSGMTEEEKALWQNDDVSEREQLDKSIPELTALFVETPVDIKAWADLPTIAQWSLLLAVENTLPNKVTLYKGWADRDRLAGCYPGLSRNRRSSECWGQNRKSC